MRLITHNFLKCNRPECDGGYPLGLRVDTSRIDTVELLDQELNKDFVQNVLQKVDYTVLRKTAEQFNKNLCETLTNDVLENDDFLKTVNDVLFNLNVKEGSLVCPKCNSIFPIKDGIPNMLDDADDNDVSNSA